jgi:hypothetical protein
MTRVKMKRIAGLVALVIVKIEPATHMASVALERRVTAVLGDDGRLRSWSATEGGGNCEADA